MESSAGHHRKIELQSAEDLTYLIANVRRAATESINAAFPPVDGAAGHDDELRVQIERLVDEYITRTFTLAAPNLSINGLDLSDPTPYLSGAGTDQTQPEEQHEPFDGRKRQRVEDLAREEEDLLREIAALKKRVPGAVANSWGEAVRNGIARDEEMLEKVRMDVVMRAAAGKNKRLLEGVGRLERQDDVEGRFEGAVETLGRVKRDMPATVAKMERARVAGGYVVTER